MRTRPRTAFLAALGVAVAAGLVLFPHLASGNPDHFAGDYFMFAKAAGDGASTDRTTLEPECDASNQKQAEVSGSTSFFYGRIHSNADLANSGGSNVFVDTGSPNPEITYGVNEPETCQLQQEPATYGSGAPTNITANGDGTSTDGPYQIGEHGWPGNLGSFLDDTGAKAGVGFGNDVTQVLPGASCDNGTSLTDTDTYTITAADAGRVICNGTGLINFGQQGLGSLATPFRITMVSHGPIEINDSNLVLAPVAHGVLAWTDMRFSDNATAIKLAGQGVHVVERAILFTPRSGQDVSGSDQATLCLQMIGQGRLKAAGSTSHFGPLAPGCGVPAGVVTAIHAGTNHVDDIQGTAVEVGTTIHDSVAVTSHMLPATQLIGPITVNRYANGTCTGTPAATVTYTAGNGTGTTYVPGTSVSLDNVLSFTPDVGVYSYRASYGGDANRNMASFGICEGPVWVVDADVEISPASAANEVGTDHDLTVSVTVDGGAVATGGASVTATKESGPGTLDPSTCTTPGGASPQSCDVTLTSLVAGTSVVSASASIPIDVDGDGTTDITLVRATGTTAATGAAEKTWVKVRVLISPASDANEIGSNHVLTLTLEKATAEDENGPVWEPVESKCVTATLINADGATASFVDTDGANADCDAGPPANDATEGNACVTGVDGTCTVTITSPTVGETTIAGHFSGTVAGADIGPKSTDPDASKTWVAVRLTISPASDANEVGTEHVLTLTLEQATSVDGEGNPLWSPAEGECVTATLTDDDGATASFVDADTANADCDAGPPANDTTEGNACVTDALGTCTVTITSPTAGTTTVEGHFAGTVAGAGIGAKSTDPDASKTWVAVRLKIAPASAANEVDTDHTLTLTLEQSVEDGVWTPVEGECVTATLANGAGASAGFVPEVGATDCDAGPPANDAIDGNACVTGVDGECEVTISSPTAGTTTITGHWAGGTVAGAVIDAKATDPAAEKTWVRVRITISPATAVNPIGTEHVLTLTLQKATSETNGAPSWQPVSGECVTATFTDHDGATTSFVDKAPANPDCDAAPPAEDAVEGNACVTGASGTCTVTITSPTTGKSVVEGHWAGGTVAEADVGAKVTEPDAEKVWVVPQVVASTLLIIDEDSLDNGIHFNATGGLIKPSGPNFFSTRDVNDDRPSHTQRDVLRYFGNNVGATITVKTGQSGDEGWFAPTCIPQKWLGGTSSACLQGDDRATAIDRYAKGVGGVPAQSRLDKIPAVMPLRALGLTELVGKTVCAVVYDSDVNVNYVRSTFPFTEGNLQGETLGIVAFRVDQVRTLDGFSSSTLPQVTLTIGDTSTCGNWQLFNAPVPRSSSVPPDRKAEVPVTATNSSGYRQLKTFLNEELFF